MAGGYLSKYRPALLAGVVLCVIIGAALLLGQLVKTPEEEKKPVRADIPAQAKKPGTKPHKEFSPKDKGATQPQTKPPKEKQHPTKGSQDNKKPKPGIQKPAAALDLQQFKHELQELKKRFVTKVAALEKELTEQKKANDKLKEHIEKARKSDQKPDVKETTPTSEMVDAVEKQASSANEKHQKTRQERVKEESTWLDYFQKMAQESKARPQETKSPGKDPLKEIKRAFSSEEEATQNAVKTAKKAEDRMSPGRGKTGPASKIKQLTRIHPSQEIYDKSFQGFISFGNKKSKKPSVQWAILNDPGEGLKGVYPLFNMTPLIRLNNTYYDLSTGESVNKYKIAAFAPTGILSEDPWRDFGDMIEMAGRRSGVDLSDADVIYFMSDRMLYYFRTKVNHALDCAVNEGNLKPDKLKDGQIRVVGRVLAVTAPDGNHRFGIYIPTLVEIFDKTTGKIEDIKLDTAACFGNDPDVKPLLAEGAI